MSGGGGKRGWAADEHAARIHPNRNDAGTALVFAQRFAGNQRTAPIVERAGDGRVMDDALAQRAMFVRAFVHQGMNVAIGGAENRDLPPAKEDRKSTRLNSSH